MVVPTVSKNLKGVYIKTGFQGYTLCAAQTVALKPVSADVLHPQFR